MISRADRRVAGSVRLGSRGQPSRRFSGLIRQGIHLFLAAVLLAGGAGAVYGSSERAETISGDAGSDELGASDLGRLIRDWTSAFQRDHAGATLRLRPARSLASPGAFDEARGDAIYVGYRLNREAIDGFSRKLGYKPTPIRVALDAVTIFVHRDNPIRGMTLAQAGSVFSRSPMCRGAQYLATWGALGLIGEWRTRPLQVFAIGSADDVYDYFSEQALCGGALGEFVQVRPDSGSVAGAVSESLNAIGYGRGGSTTVSVKPVPLAVDANMPFVAPSERNAVSGAYPLTRFLHIYVNKSPNRPLAGVQADFVRFVLSAEGQQIASRYGYIPVTPDVAKKEQKLIGTGQP